MPSPVARCELAPGFEISRVLTGLWQIADLERSGHPVDLNSTAAAIASYAEAGFTTFDMADHYGSAELVAGRYRVLYASSIPVQLCTKWVPNPGPITRGEVRTAVDRARHRLGAEVIDLLQFHAWSFADPSWLDPLRYLNELKSEGLIRHLGVTNFDTAHLRIAIKSGIPIVSNQVCFSLLDRRPAQQLAGLCQESGIALLAYGTVAGGFLADRWLGVPEPNWRAEGTWSQMKYGRFIDVAGGWDVLQRVLRVADGIARKHAVSIANVACRYVLEQPAVAGIIIGARLGVTTHIDENVRLCQFTLDSDDHAALQAILSIVNPIPGDSGDEYRKPPFLTASGDLSHHIEAFPAPFEVRRDPDGTRRCFSRTSWESLAGFCRAVRRGDRIWVSGTTATHDMRLVGGSDPAAQTHFIIDKIEGALRSLGGRLEDVVQTRVFVSSMRDWEAVARAHGERFHAIQPANTLVQANLVGPEYLVEMEAVAELREGL